MGLGRENSTAQFITIFYYACAIILNNVVSKEAYGICGLLQFNFCLNINLV